MKQIFLLLLVLPALASAQDSLSFEAPVNPRPVVMRQSPVIKIAPLSLIDLDATIQAAVEIPLRQRLSIQQEIGYGGPSLDPLRRKNWDWFYMAYPKSTFRSRTQVRYYFSPTLTRQKVPSQAPSGLYVASDLLFKSMIHKTERGPARIRRNVYGLHANVGFQAAPSRKHPNFLVDVYVGVGFRIVSVRQVTDSLVFSLSDHEREDLRESRFAPFEGTLRKPSMTAGVKLGWMINSGQKVKRK